MPVQQDINKTYDLLQTRYANLLARGADSPRGGFPHQMDNIRSQLDSVAYTIRNWRGPVERLNDIIVSVGLRVKADLDKIESKFPAGTMVIPGSTVHAPGRLPETMLPKIPMEDLASQAPEGIGMARGAELLNPSPWYFWNGMDLRIVGAAIVGGIVFIAWRAKTR